MGHIDPWSSNNVFLIPKARRPPKIFNVQLFNFFGNECQNGLVWTYKVWKGTKSWNLVNLALIFEQWQTNLSAQGHIDPWSSEIGLKATWNNNNTLYFLVIKQLYVRYWKWHPLISIYKYSQLKLPFDLFIKQNEYFLNWFSAI